MKLVFIIYRDVLEERVSKMLGELEIDYYTHWEEVKGKGHNTDAHLGTRTFPGFNFVKMIAFEDESLLPKVIGGIKELNKEAIRQDDKIRLFQIPLEVIV
jgi:nitrogen regulatory protein PII